ncbi:S-layer family protein [Nostoc punctiforme FACHB-252]|uniref:S-layer family protein n=1 Tax=Nostoc punctiforme FACHB-252 TaxID=1357509 RepID=A0ABR8HEU6_NOSPU|nr:S-layer family protein [Nostoc punctiforme]MBD2614329.1 S-layer family protein [Nostoc punctiforme FACHB-252]
MKQFFCQKILIASAIYISCLITGFPVLAQISSDNTLGDGQTVVSPGTTPGLDFVITGGTQVGNNLFHSFREFSVPTGGEAFFNNTAAFTNINNIISRVTGGSISNIDGLIRENYGANFILINPSGINFGTKAQLNIGGSFLASTAESLKFADGSEFSATDATSPRLTISVPIGLQFGQNPQAIRLQGQGHNITLQSPIFSPFTRGNTEGLKVQPGNTLALVGGGIISEGGTLTAEGGRIDLGSVAGGLVSLNPSPQGWNLGYQGVTSFQDIALSQKALADTSGPGSGSIQLQGRNISIRDGSVVLIQTQGTESAAGINVNASESLSLVSTTTDGQISSNLFTETIGGGKSGDISVNTPRLVLQDGAAISAATYTPAAGGNIDIKADNYLEVSGFSPFNPTRFSNITAGTFGPGNAGTLTVTTQQLTALSGGNIASVTAGTGSGGNVTVNASKLVELLGVTPFVFTPSQITAGTGGPGKAGSVTVNTQRLVIKDGGRVDASTLASGPAGSVTINAQDSVEVSGKVPGSVNPSLIISSGNIVDPLLQQLLRVPPVPSGYSGDVIINTGRLIVKDGAQVTARNDGTGDAGTLQVNAGSILLENQGGITAATKGGQGGNIDLRVKNSLQVFGNSQISSDNFGTGAGGRLTIEASQLTLDDRSLLSAATTSGEGGNISLQTNALLMRHNSQISATAGGSGNGGNINIAGFSPANFVTLLEGSKITADAFQGMGGNISINTRGFFVCPTCEITASSQLGVAGQISIITPEAENNFEIIDVPQEVAKPEEVVAQACRGTANQNRSEFTITGRGGLPPRPSEQLSSGALISFEPSDISTTTKVNNTSQLPPPARGWYVNPQGIVVLASQVPNPTPYGFGLTSANCQ